MVRPPLSESELAARRRSFRRVVLFFGFVFLSAILFQAWRGWQLHHEAVGDGRTVASYRYDLSNLTVPSDLLVASGLPRDRRQTLVNPRSITAEELEELNAQLGRRGSAWRIAVSNDIVLGVQVNGESRAYPVRFMQWHEIINDTLGGVPIAVTFDPLCAAAVVFDRRVAGEERLFGFSGLLYNSNLVMYDRHEARADESLWSQLAGRPIAGPAVAAGHALEILPVFVGRFAAWREAHPKTTIFPGEESMKGQYKEGKYIAYYREGKPQFPVRPEPTADGPFKPFDMIRAVRTDQDWAIEPHDPQTATADPLDQATVICLWFAWHAIHSDDDR